MLGPSSLLVVVQGGLKATCVMHIWDDMGLFGTIFDLFPKNGMDEMFGLFPIYRAKARLFYESDAA
jgi:hypothetical protein